MPIPTLHGKLIALRRLRRSDAASIQRHANNRNIARFLPRLPYPYTMAEARMWITTTSRLARADKAYDFGIEDRESGKIVGMIGLRNLNRQDRNDEVGYWIGKSFPPGIRQRSIMSYSENRVHGASAGPRVCRGASKERYLRQVIGQDRLCPGGRLAKGKPYKQALV